MRVVLFILLTLSSYIMEAQEKISGTYLPQQNIFVTEDKTYWVEGFQDNVAKISKDGYLGLINTTGKIVVRPKYDKIYPFYNGVAIICLNNKYGIINKKGKEILPPTYGYINDFRSELAWFYDEQSKGWGLLNNKGIQIAPPTTHSISKYQGKFYYYDDFDNNGGRTLIDQSGKIIFVIPKDEFIKFPNYFNDKFFRGRFYYSYKTSVIREKEFFDERRINRELGIPFDETPPNDILLYFNEGKSIIPKMIGDKLKFGYIDENGKVTIPFEYEDAHIFINNLACVKKEGKWGAIDKAGKTIIPFKYEYLESTRSEYFIFGKNEKVGIISKEGKVIVEPKYLAAKYLFGSFFGFLSQELTFNKNNKFKIEDYSDYYSRFITPHPLYDKWGVVDIVSKSTILPFNYNSVIKVNNNFGLGIKYEEIIIKQAESNYIEGLVIQHTAMPKEPSIIQGTKHSTIFSEKGMGKTYLSIPVISISQQIEYIPPFLETEEYYSFLGAYIDNTGTEIQDSLLLEKLNKKRIKNQTYKYIIEITIGYSNYKLMLTNYQEQNKRKIKKKILDFKLSDYDDAYLGSSGIIVKKNGLFGYLDLTGKMLLPISYSFMKETASGILKVSMDNESFYLIDKKGNIIN